MAYTVMIRRKRKRIQHQFFICQIIRGIRDHIHPFPPEQGYRTGHVIGGSNKDGLLKPVLPAKLFRKPGILRRITAFGIRQQIFFLHAAGHDRTA